VISSKLLIEPTNKSQCRYRTGTRIVRLHKHRTNAVCYDGV